MPRRKVAARYPTSTDRPVVDLHKTPLRDKPSGDLKDFDHIVVVFTGECQPANRVGTSVFGWSVYAGKLVDGVGEEVVDSERGAKGGFKRSIAVRYMVAGGLLAEGSGVSATGRDATHLQAEYGACRAVLEHLTRAGWHGRCMMLVTDGEHVPSWLCHEASPTNGEENGEAWCVHQAMSLADRVEVHRTNLVEKLRCDRLAADAYWRVDGRPVMPTSRWFGEFVRPRHPVPDELKGYCRSITVGEEESIRSAYRQAREEEYGGGSDDDAVLTSRLADPTDRTVYRTFMHLSAMNKGGIFVLPYKSLGELIGGSNRFDPRRAEPWTRSIGRLVGAGQLQRLKPTGLDRGHPMSALLQVWRFTGTLHLPDGLDPQLGGAEGDEGQTGFEPMLGRYGQGGRGIRIKPRTGKAAFHKVRVGKRVS